MVVTAGLGLKIPPVPARVSVVLSILLEITTCVALEAVTVRVVGVPATIVLGAAAIDTDITVIVT
jgi:hypothetical protein